MAARRLVLSGAILGLVWSVYAETTNRCESAPCNCDEFGRLTCDCKGSGEMLTLTSDGLGAHISTIDLNNCQNVTITNSSLININSLSSITLNNIQNLTLQESSIKLHNKAQSVKIIINNSTIDNVPSFLFHGNIDSIIFNDLKILRISSFAFVNIKNTNKIIIENSDIKVIEQFAFKQFEVKYLHIIGGKIGDDNNDVPSRIMSNIEILDKFMLKNVEFSKIHSSAFVIKKPKTLAILNCLFKSLDSESFDISVKGTVIIKDNVINNLAFATFLKIRNYHDDEDDDNNVIPQINFNHHPLMFKNNTINEFQEGSLLFDRYSFKLELSNILINRLCDCNNIELWKNQLLNQTNAYKKINIKEKRQLPLVNTDYQDPDTLLCLNDYDDNQSSISLVEYDKRNCQINQNPLLMIFLITGLLIALIVLISLVIYCCNKRKRRRKRRGSNQSRSRIDEKQWISVPTTAPDIITSKKSDNVSGAVDSRITMVVPDGRLYKETEFHVIVEKAEPLTTEL